jgi:hypothetical protein
MGVVALGVAGGVAAQTPPAPSPERAPFGPILAAQVTRYPGMQPADVYKLVFQATMGSRHAGLDSAMAAEWLSREVAQLGPGPEEPVLDTISPDGRMVRVNLRPYLAAGGSRVALLAAFVRTAREFPGSRAALRRALVSVERLAGARALPLRRGVLHAYFERMRARGYPAVEHSDGYRAAYHPSYRVVLRTFLPETGGAAVR